MLIAKAHKVAERIDDPKRDSYIAKDALDMLRLLRGCDIDSVVHVLAAADRRPRAGLDAGVVAAIAATVAQGRKILRTEFASATARGCVLAGHAAAGRDDPEIVAASLAALVTRLLEHF